MKQRTVFKKQREDLLFDATIIYEDELYDEDIQDIRYAKWQTAVMIKHTQDAKLPMERYDWYFFYDGSCKEHDFLGCRECRHYANGRCPSYWEEWY